MEHARSVGNLAGQSVKPSTTLEVHASTLNDLATDLASQTARLSRLLERLSGPELKTAESDPKSRPEPQSGVIHVSQFAAQRIRLEVNEIAELIGRLENLA